MLELIIRFLGWTGIHPETFGRLTVNNPDLVYRLEDPDFALHQEAQERILDFMHNYEDAKS